MDQPTTNHIEIHGMSFDYKNKVACKKLFNALDLNIPQGQFLSVLGVSGCGKTTFLKLISGLLSPTNGNLLIGGVEAEEVRKNGRIGYVFQTPVLFDWRTVLENILLPFETLKTNTSLSKDRRSLEASAYELLELLALKGYEKAYPQQLSGGMQSRVAIARALIYQPEVLLMDEPFGSLDELTRAKLHKLLQELHSKRNATIVFITHSITEAILLSDRVIVLNSNSSNKIHLDMNIELPKPRIMQNIQGTKAFADYSKMLMQALTLNTEIDEETALIN